VGAVDSMEFESTLALKALPGREFRQNPVIDAHRYITSLQPCASSYLGAIRSSRGIFRRVRLYTRKRLPRSGFVQTCLWEVKGMFPVRLDIVGQLCVPLVCWSSSGGTGDGDRTSRLQSVSQGRSLRTHLKLVCVPAVCPFTC